jgi:enoyl-CoA hydratase/carnithine racemase
MSLDEAPPATVGYETRGQVALITLNRPDQLNAFNGQMAMDLKRAIGDAVSDRTVRAIVLTGAGRAFCSGADLSQVAGRIPIGGDSAVMLSLDRPFATGFGPDVSEGVKRAERLGYFIRTKKPIIAAINGPAVGLGLLIALYADVRFASANAFLMTALGQRGLIAEHGLAWLLSRYGGMSCAMDLLISSRRVPAAEAKALGLVNQVTEPEALLETAISYAEGIATTMSPRSVAVMKAQVWHANMASFDDALEVALAETQLAFQHSDTKEGVAAFRERRPPRFADI